MGALKMIGLITVTVVVTCGAVAWYGARRWETGTRELRARMDAARVPVTPRVIDFAELADLPAPVQTYFRTVLEEGRPMVVAAHVRHDGTFNMGASSDQWKPFTSDQAVVTRRPGFDWDARISMLPGLTVRVHDAYVAGEGLLHASVLGLFTVADLRGTPEVAEGELMRYVAEAAWYPTALLPSQGVRWAPVDGRSARATLVDGAVSVTLLFTFADTGVIDTIRAEARGRAVDDRVIPTPWLGRFWNDERVDGMRVPRDGEVAWLLPDGPRPYWRGHITAITYEFAP